MGLKPNIPREIEPSTNTVFFNIGYTSTFFNATTCIHILNTSLQFIKCLNWTDINQNQIFKSCSKNFSFLEVTLTFFACGAWYVFFADRLGFWPFSLNAVKTPLMRENGQKPGRRIMPLIPSAASPSAHLSWGGYMGNTWIGTWVVRG